MQNQAKRNNYWDACKGIAIIAVVFIHASGGASSFEKYSFNWSFGLVLRQFLNYAVPLFFVIAGYFSLTRESVGPLNYYKKRFLKLLTPYLIWTLIYLLLRTPLSPPTVKEIIGGFFLGTGIGIGYFVIVLIQYVILTPALHRLSSKFVHLVIIFITSSAGISFTYYFTALRPDQLFGHFPFNGILFFVWYPFYHTGLYIRKFQCEQFFIEKGKLILIPLVAALLISIAEGFFWAEKDNFNFGASQLKLSSFFFSFFLFILAIFLSTQKTLLHKKSILTWLGINSYAVYLIHMLPIGIFQKIFKSFPFIFELQPIYILILTLFSLIASAITIKAAIFMFPANKIKYVLGT